MLTAMILSCLCQLPAPNPGDTVILANWYGRSDVTVTVRDLSAGPVVWNDGAGHPHHEVTITYRDPRDGDRTTTLSWFLKHVRPVLVPVGLPLSLTDLPFPFQGPVRLPVSNQTIKDGIARPADLFYHVTPVQQDYYSRYRARTGVPQ